MFEWNQKKRVFTDRATYVLDTYNLKLKLERNFVQEIDDLLMVNKSSKNPIILILQK